MTIPAALVSVDEYLNTDYSPDSDYVDGVLVDRHVGQKTHGVTQKRMLLFFSALEKQLGIFALQEHNVKIGPTRFRVPDICVMMGGEPAEEIFTTAPFLCIEVLSPDDRMSRMQTKIRDYLGMGVLRTTDPVIEMPLAEVMPA